MADKDTKTSEHDGHDVAEVTDEVVEEASSDTEDAFAFVEDPQFDVEYKGDCAYEVKVTVPVANETQESGKMLDELQHEAEVPGFRKGRAPRKLIERKFSKAVRGEVAGKLVSAAFKKLVKDQDLKPIQLPEIEGIDKDTERKEGEPLTFTLKFDVAPRVELGKYRGISIERPVVTIEDSDVKESVDEIRTRYAVFEPLESGKAKKGDQVIIDFTGKVDGNEFPGGTARDYPYILGTQRFFAEFEKALSGCSQGDELTCAVTLPENNPNEDLRGKKAEFAISVKQIKRRELPKLTDAFAKQAGFESLKDMRQKVADQLRENSSAHSDRLAQGVALDQIVEASTFEIPKSMVEGVAHDFYQDDLRRLMSMRVPVTQIEEHEKEIRDNANERALREIKQQVVLGEIAEAEGITVTEEDFESEVESIAQRAGAAVEAVNKYLEEGDRRSSYESRIQRAKALKVIMDNATITDKEVSRDEMEEAESTAEDNDA